MSDPYTLFENLANEAEIPEDGILSRPIFNNDQMRVTLFGMSAGQELTEHTTTMEAVVQVVRGAGEFTFGGEAKTLSAGAWARMEPNLPHSIRVTEPMVLLLMVLK